MDFTQSMDNGYMIPTSVAVGSGEAADIRCVCDTVEDFKTFLDTTGMELRYEGLVTYEKVNKLLKVYKGNDTWQNVGEGGGSVDTSSFITLTQLSQQLNSYYTKSETDEAMNDKANKVHTHNEYLTELPTHTHSEYLKELPTHEHEQYLTEHQDISHKADKENTYTKAQTDNKISEEIAKAQLGGSGEVDLSAYATKTYVDDEISNCVMVGEIEGEVEIEEEKDNKIKDFRLPSLKPLSYANNPIITVDMVTDKSDVTGCADPFIVKENGMYYCFFEATTGSVATSQLAYAYSYDAVTWNYGEIIPTSTRAAFPNVFKYKGEWYMLPDTNGNIDVYKTDSFPTGWTRVNTLIKGIFSDTDIVNVGGVWYMFTLNSANNLNSVSVYVNESGEWNNTSWTIHPSSPIISKRGARLAGKIIKCKDNLILPVQGTVTGVYGEKTEYYTISNLTKTTIQVSDGVVAMTGLQGDDWTKQAVHQIDMLAQDNGNLYVVDGLFGSGEQYSIGIYTDGDKLSFASSGTSTTSVSTNTYSNVGLTRKYDSDFMFDSNKIKINYNGYYLVNAQFDCDKFQILKNGTTVLVDSLSSSCSKILKLNKDDVISVKVYSSKSTINNSYETSFIDVIRMY